MYILLIKYTEFSIPCIVHKLTGFYCPGCGITRMFLYLFELDFKSAFLSNQLVFILLPLLFIYFVLEIRYIITNKQNVMNDKKFNIVWLFLVIITIIYGILRNLKAFDFLAPK